MVHTSVINDLPYPFELAALQNAFQGHQENYTGEHEIHSFVSTHSLVENMYMCLEN